jgi:hypothetical protein
MQRKRHYVTVMKLASLGFAVGCGSRTDLDDPFGESNGDYAETGGVQQSGGSSADGGAPGDTGGSSTGGASTGGVATGGFTTGGAVTGGAATGGVGTGGAATGGVSTGGAATGGVGTGGAVVVCMAGELADCIGQMACTGTRECFADGSGWGPCSCGGGTGGAGTGGVGTGGMGTGGVGTGGAPGCIPDKEACDGKDNDCDGFVDEDNPLGCQLYHRDHDEDGWGNVDDSQCLCAPEGEYTSQTWPDDCHDGDASIHPTATEICDGKDNDCSFAIDDGAAQCGCDQHYAQNGKAYLACTNALDWPSAEQYCLAIGYHLVSVGSVAENSTLHSIVNQYPTTRWWMGINDRAAEGAWVWSDGSAHGYTNWAAGEPNNIGDEDCGQLNRFWPDSTWNDEPCSTALNFVCEAPPLHQ